MRVVFRDLETHRIWSMAMEPLPNAYLGPGSAFGDGYHLANDTRPMEAGFIYEECAEERLLSCMYEAGLFMGLWSSMKDNSEEEKPRYVWTLLPETQEELQHIENVIVPYGRFTKKAEGSQP